VSLNIKNDEAHRLAQELAALTGESLTTAVTQALRERLTRVRRHGLAERLMTIAHDCGPRWKEPFKSAEHCDLLYDDLGLPK